MTERTVGVEEEFLLVDRDSGRPRAVGQAVLAASDALDTTLTGELQREQVETGTRPCRTLEDLRSEVRTVRATAARAAEAQGVHLAALGTSPLPVEPTLSPSDRYREMARRFGMTVAEELTCGCHVHVGISSPEEGVAVLDRIRSWLAPLIALSANSPFWQGNDTGYLSYRGQVWQRWPSAGPYETFGSARAYRDVVARAVETGTVLDEGMIYFDARLSVQHPTVEIRVADVCLEPDDAVLVAALARGLVETAARAWQHGGDVDTARVDLLRLASWRAARSGVDGELLDPTTWKPAPAGDVLHRLVEHVGPALDDAGEGATVQDLLAAVLARGTGARRQREVAERAGDLCAVVADAAHRTAEG
jgi:carboxylate-amine ligase